jgi:hypothetical protein
MLTGAWETVYKPHPEVIGAAVFAWTANERWSAFRVDDAAELRRRLESYRVSDVTTAPEPRWERRRIVLAGDWCNVRETPSLSGAATEFRANGTVVEWAKNRDVADADKPALRWQMVRIKGRVGWVRSDAATLAILEVSSPPPPPDDGAGEPGGVYVMLPELLRKGEEAMRYADALEAMARAIRAQVKKAVQ